MNAGRGAHLMVLWGPDLGALPRLNVADIDNLKEVNDEYGHLVGEFTVGAIGRIIGSFPNQNRRATRFGGDEYQVILPDEDTAAFVETAELIRCTVEGHAFEREGVALDPTLSLQTRTSTP